jgi:hypothetical protein
VPFQRYKYDSYYWQVPPSRVRVWKPPCFTSVLIACCKATPLAMPVHRPGSSCWKKSRAVIVTSLLSALASQGRAFSVSHSASQSSSALTMSGSIMDVANFATQQAPQTTQFVTNKMCPFGTNTPGTWLAFTLSCRPSFLCMCIFLHFHAISSPKSVDRLGSNRSPL